MTPKHIVFIGGGNMTRAILGGLTAANPEPASAPHRLSVVQPSNPKRDELAADFNEAGVNVVKDVSDLSAPVDVAVWAVKPQVLQQVARDCAWRFDADTLHISIAAGVGTAALSAWLGNDRVVRTMPNTPAMVGCGATGMYAKAAVGVADRHLVQALFEVTGVCLWVEEEALIDAVTAVSGSGPAYVFYILNAMIEGGQALGLAESTAKQLAIATFAGAAELARQSTDTPAQLQQNVTSKGGATAQAIAIFESQNLAETIQAGMRACAARAVEMGAQIKQDC